MEYEGAVVPGPAAMRPCEHERRSLAASYIPYVRKLKSSLATMGRKQPLNSFIANQSFLGFERWVMRFVGRLTWDEWDAYFMPWDDLDAAGITWDELESPTSILHIRSYRITPTLRRARGIFNPRLVSGAEAKGGFIPGGHLEPFPMKGIPMPVVNMLKDDTYLEGSLDLAFSLYMAHQGMIRADYDPIVSDRVPATPTLTPVMSQSIIAAAQNETNVYLAGQTAAHWGTWPYLFPGIAVEKGIMELPYTSSKLLLDMLSNYIYPVGLYQGKFFYYPWRDDDNPRNRWDLIFVDPNWR